MRNRVFVFFFILLIGVLSCNNIIHDSLDKERPCIVSVSPGPFSQDIPVNISIIITFSKAMNVKTLNSSTIRISGNGERIPFTVFYRGKIAVLTLSNILTMNSVYHITVTENIEDMSKNSLVSGFDWSFKTNINYNDSSLSITGTHPQPDSSEIVRNSLILVSFSHRVNPVSILEEGNLKVVDSMDQRIAGDIRCRDTFIIFYPQEALSANEEYRVQINGIKDISGNYLAQAYEWKFQTQDKWDHSPPWILDWYPWDKAIDIATDIYLTISLSEHIDPTTISYESVNLTKDLQKISGRVYYDFGSRTIFFRPWIELEKNTAYSVKMHEKPADFSGNLLTSGAGWQFTTVY